MMKMKKWIMYAILAGLVANAIYWLCKKEKTDVAMFKTGATKVDDEPETQEDLSQNTDIVKEMNQAKNESAQAVYERHAQAGSIMKEAYSNIMEDFVEDFSEKQSPDKEVDIDEESVVLMKKLDSISDELDDLLK